MQLRKLFLTPSSVAGWDIVASSSAGGVGTATFAQPLPFGYGDGGVTLAGGGTSGVGALLVASLGGPLSFRFWSSAAGAPALVTFHADYHLNAGQALAVPVPTIGSIDTVAFTAAGGAAQLGVSAGWIVNCFDMGVVEVLTSAGPL